MSKAPLPMIAVGRKELPKPSVVSTPLPNPDDYTRFRLVKGSGDVQLVQFDDGYNPSEQLKDPVLMYQELPDPDAVEKKIEEKMAQSENVAGLRERLTAEMEKFRVRRHIEYPYHIVDPKQHWSAKRNTTGARTLDDSTCSFIIIPDEGAQDVLLFTSTAI